MNSSARSPGWQSHVCERTLNQHVRETECMHDSSQNWAERVMREWRRVEEFRITNACCEQIGVIAYGFAGVLH